MRKKAFRNLVTRMYHPTTRLLTALELLQTYGTLSGAELARRLEVSTRTVRHYLALLRDLGIPVEATPGKGGGYRLTRGYKLPPLLFTADEAVALTLGLLTARRSGLAVAAPAVEGALAKVTRVLPAEIQAQVQAIQETLVIDVVYSGAGIPRRTGSGGLSSHNVRVNTSGIVSHLQQAQSQLAASAAG